MRPSVRFAVSLEVGFDAARLDDTEVDYLTQVRSSLLATYSREPLFDELEDGDEGIW